MTGLAWITPDLPADAFPPVERALREPDGLLAVGGDLSIERLLAAYRRGIFPWFNEGQPVLWWSPNPRAVIFPQEFHVSRSLRRRLRKAPFSFSVDHAFAEVMSACGTMPRHGQHGSWITPAMLTAYIRLHELGFAHSVEVWQDGKLAGGIYGVVLGRVFFGESMFSRATDASKAAMLLLVREMTARGMPLLDCQVESTHLDTLGCRAIPRGEFLELLNEYCAEDTPGRWQLSVATEDLAGWDPAGGRP